MASLADVENALVATLAAALFPGTNYLPGAIQASSVSGGNVKIYRGWPVANQLDTELAAGTSNVSVFSGNGASRNTTRFSPVWRQLTTSQPTLTVETTATTATFAGTCADGQLAGIGFGNTPYSTAVTAQDTPATVAAKLQALINGATVSGATVTVPYAAGLVARTAGSITAVREVQRQQQQVTVTCWCPDPLTRDALLAAIELAFAGLEDANGDLTRFITLANGQAIGPITYARTIISDVASPATLFRADMMLMCEYAFTQTQLQTAMLFGLTNLNGTYSLDSTSGDVLMTDGDVALVGADGIEIRP